jgi:signal transduction histidine kinase
VIGSASARVMVASVTKEEPLGIDELMELVDETRQAIAYSHELEITTRKLAAANERLKELDHLKDEFISTVTHELRTPLTAIRSVAEILYSHQGIDTGRQRGFTEIIVKESERLTRLINHVLDFQKIESGRMSWNRLPVDMKEIIRDSIQATDRLIRDRSIVLELSLPKAVPLITGDRDRLIQVMVNLISNAVKFCKTENGHIYINLTREPDHLKVDVSDNGIGISDEHQDVIFQAFRQITDTTKGRPQGSGLGLVITRRIIDYHQGNIWVESEPGKGSTFSFRLPLLNGAGPLNKDAS